MTPDERWMKHALELAQRGAGRTRPNPHVGCVITRDDTLLSEGWHRKAGQAHAEVDALRHLVSAAGCTAYVNLEPCSHHGRTPPCVDALVQSGVTRVVVGMIDPDPRVSGRGVAHLRSHGIEVEVGVLEDECRYLNRGYLKFVRTRRPWVMSKWAMTLDGKIATHTGNSAWVTGEESRAYVHELRDTLDAILVGSGTVRIDDPLLTCRRDGGRNPVRVVLDSLLSLDPERRIFDDTAPVIVFCSHDAPQTNQSRFEARGVQVVRIHSVKGGLDLDEVLEELGRHEITSVLVEGGQAIHGAFMDAGLVDEVAAFIAPKIAGGELAPSPVGGRGVALMANAFRLEDHKVRTLGDDLVIVGRPVVSEEVK